MELEYEEPSSNAVLRFHLQCQSIWETERQEPQSRPWRSVEHDLPPFSRTVETRLELGASRSIILNVMRLCDSETGKTVWINANTNAPLPDSWRPVQWRDPQGAAASQPAAEETSNARPRRA